MAAALGTNTVSVRVVSNPTELGAKCALTTLMSRNSAICGCMDMLACQVPEEGGCGCEGERT